ncbi:hypothetical protein ACWGVR_09815 [Streptomyces xanthophaeus]
MIKNLMRRGLPALAFAALPLLTTAASPAAAYPVAPVAEVSVASPAPAYLAAGAPTALAALALFDAIDLLPVANEQREGYKRDLYKHWNRGLTPQTAATRKEVIRNEAVVAPQVVGRAHQPFEAVAELAQKKRCGTCPSAHLCTRVDEAR